MNDIFAGFNIRKIKISTVVRGSGVAAGTGGYRNTLKTVTIFIDNLSDYGTSIYWRRNITGTVILTAGKHDQQGEKQ